MINGYEYAFEDLNVVIMGRPIIAMKEVSYGASKEHGNLLGRGNRPVAMTRGKKEPKPAKLVIAQSEFEALVRATPVGKDPTDWAPFEMIVAYAPEGGVITTDIVPYCRVSDWEKKSSQDDQSMWIELSLVTGLPKLNQ
jgi:hypothetical protein